MISCLAAGRRVFSTLVQLKYRPFLATIMLLIDSRLSLLSCFPQYMLLNAKIATQTSGARKHDHSKIA